MKKTTVWIIASVALAAAIFLLSGDAAEGLRNPGFWTWRGQSVIFFGVLSFVFMSVCMLIALRPKWVDRLSGGLDKAYGLHKWLGIALLVTLPIHWLSEKLPKWLSSTGWFPPRVKSPPLPRPEWYDAMRELALPAGEWAFYFFVALALIALLKRIPYHYFRYVHKLFPLVFLGGAYHAVMIQPFEWWRTPAAYLVVALALAGAVAAFISLFQRIGAPRQAVASIASVEKHAGLVDVRLEVPDNGFPHSAGQFAFVTFSPGEGPHPFTIASSGKNPNSIRFAIKSLGDYTNTLPERLHAGQQAVIEGPYGQFTFQSRHARQVWVAGGIGVTPFMARLEALALEGRKLPYPVDFWYCSGTTQDAAFPRDLEALCRRSGVTLHRMCAANGQFLDAGIIKDTVADLSDASVWFCGPAAFARSLRAGLKRFGVPPRNFHNERFSMR